MRRTSCLLLVCALFCACSTDKNKAVHMQQVADSTRYVENYKKQMEDSLKKTIDYLVRVDSLHTIERIERIRREDNEDKSEMVFVMADDRCYHYESECPMIQGSGQGRIVSKYDAREMRKTRCEKCEKITFR